jgi:hypothetical protein
MSTSSTDDRSITLVIGENGAGSFEDVVAPLRPLPGGIEVVVRNGGNVLVPEQWRDGIDTAEGEIVCLTISVMQPAAGWLDTAWRLSAEAAAVGGAIEPGEGLRLRDWAEYFCRYARDMLPFELRETTDLPGDNAVYRRTALLAVSDTYRDGFWEPEVNRALRDRGFRLLHSPELVVHQGRSAGFRAFMRQRLVHGRAYGRQRGARFSRARNAVGVAAAVLVPFVLVLRTVREVFSRGRLRGRLLLALPALLAYDVAWAAGEAAGHLDSLRGR